MRATKRLPAAASAGALALLALTALGCSMVSLHRDRQAARQIGLVTGRVTSPAGNTDDVLVALFRLERGTAVLEAVDRLTRVISDYVFVVDARTPYVITAFHDLDGDLQHDAGEPAGVLGRPDALRLQGEERLSGRDLFLRANVELPAKLRFDPAAAELPALDSIPIAAGEITDLDDDRFSAERAKQGLWSPLAAARDAGTGIYFLEPADSRRTPVLYVHGIGGSPRDFAFLVDRLDRERFQPWVFHYPSGMRLERATGVLARLVRALHREHRFDRLVVVAHSMGGLVARGGLLDVQQVDGAPAVPALVTLSTPWGGHRAASKGVKYAPAVVPAWIDVQPGSGFLATLRRELGAETEHHLFFTFDTKGIPFMLYSHDTVVTVESQLERWFQHRAERIYGYDLDHVGILNDPHVAERLDAIFEGVAFSADAAERRLLPGPG